MNWFCSFFYDGGRVGDWCWPNGGWEGDGGWGGYF